MKKGFLTTAFLCLTLVVSSMIFTPSGLTVYADEAESFTFDMSASTTEAKLNDTFDVSVSIKKDSSESDKADKFTMYAAEYTIKYDPAFFTLTSHPEFDKEDSRGVTYMMKENADQNGWTAITVSILSPEFEGLEWDSPSELLNLTFKADKIGAAAIKCERAAMGNIAGANLKCSTNGVIVAVISGNGDNSNNGDNGNNGDNNGDNNNGDNDNNGDNNGDNGNNGDNNGDSNNDNNDDNDNNGSSTFTDVNDTDWFSGAVKYVTEKGLFNGTGNGTFSPQGGMNRAMLVTVLWRLEGSPDAAGGASFNDVPSGMWYTTAVKWASENGIVNGVTADSFAPSSYVTREQIAAMLYRYAQYKGTDVSSTETLAAYSDAADISTWAQPAVKWAVAHGVISGMTDGTIRPQNTATRAQVATMLMRYAG